MAAIDHRKDDEVMGIGSRKRGEAQQMSSVADVARARDYVVAIGGPGKGMSIIQKAYRELSALYPHKDHPRDRWTERRVRSFLERDAALVKHREMVELHQAAELAKAEQELIARARKEHADFIAQTANLRSLLKRQDEDFHRDQVEGMGRGMGGVGRSRDIGD